MTKFTSPVIAQIQLGECQTESSLPTESNNCKSVSQIVPAESSSTAFESPLQASVAGIEVPNNTIAHLIELLGEDVVLLPCPIGVKGCRESGWQKTTVERMKEPDYIRQLNSAGGIAVSLGESSGGLCSIDIDDDADVEPFLLLNPALRSTLMSRGSRGCNLWVRVNGNYPRLTKLTRPDGAGWGEWRSSGGCTMIEGLHPSGVFYTRVPEVSPLVVSFANIVWPRDLTMPGVQPDEAVDAPGSGEPEEIIKRYGSPVFSARARDGEWYVKSVNEAYWAGLYAAENVILFEPDEHSFYRYDVATGLYSIITSDVIKKEISCRMLEVSRQDDTLSGLQKLRTDRTLNAIIGQLRGIVEHRQAFSVRPKIIHLANAVLRLDGFQCLREEFSPEFRSRNRSPITFDPEAGCPRFLNELLLPAVSADDAVLLQKMAGQFLLSENLTQRFVILDGLADRGKTQFVNIIQSLVGRENVTQLRSKHLQSRFELFRFLRRTLLVGVDVDYDFLSSEGASVIKGLVGGDWFDAEQKGGSGSFPFQGKFNIIMTSNARLRVKLQGDAGAWKRRMVIVRYEAPPPKKRIPNFGELLISEEGPGILNWALGGAHHLMMDIAETGDVRLTPNQSGAVDSLLAESESLRCFLRDHLVKSKGLDLTVDEIVQAYARFCPDMGWNPLPETQIHRQLPSLMLELFQTAKSNSLKRDGLFARGYRGVAFINSEVRA